MQKIYFLILLSFLCLTHANAQPRLDNPKKLEVCKTSQYLTDFTYWLYDEQLGKWRGTRYGKGGKSADAIKSEYITSLQTKIVKRDSTTYYLLIHTRWFSYYMYPELRLDLVHWKGRFIYTLSEEDFKLLCDIPLGTHVLHLHTVAQIEAKDNTDIEIKKVDNLSKPYSNETFVIRREDENTVRFKVPGGETLLYHRQFNENDINDEYYELPLSKWKILDLLSK